MGFRSSTQRRQKQAGRSLRWRLALVFRNQKSTIPILTTTDFAFVPCPCLSLLSVGPWVPVNMPNHTHDFHTVWVLVSYSVELSVRELCGLSLRLDSGCMFQAVLCTSSEGSQCPCVLLLLLLTLITRPWWEPQGSYAVILQSCPFWLSSTLREDALRWYKHSVSCHASVPSFSTHWWLLPGRFALQWLKTNLFIFLKK